MTTTKKLIWRLKEQPSTESLQRLVVAGLLTKDEAREILFNSETEEERDKKSLESEIKFLRELVEKLSSSNHSRVIDIIREVERPYARYPWYNPYVTWCSTAGNTVDITSSANTISSTDTAPNFSNIKTF